MKYFDSDFVNNCKNGERKSQKLLFEQLYKPMFRVCFRYIGQQSEAEDCVMKGFMKVFQKLENFEYKETYSLYVWVQKIMVNEALMSLRKKNNFYLMTEDTILEIPDQSDQLSNMQAEEIHEMILELPTGYRTVLNLYVIEGYAHQEIAEMLGITESTSKTQLMKAKNRLKIMIDQRENVYGKLGE